MASITCVLSFMHVTCSGTSSRTSATSSSFATSASCLGVRRADTALTMLCTVGSGALSFLSVSRIERWLVFTRSPRSRSCVPRSRCSSARTTSACEMITLIGSSSTPATPAPAAATRVRFCSRTFINRGSYLSVAGINVSLSLSLSFLLVGSAPRGTRYAAGNCPGRARVSALTGSVPTVANSFACGVPIPRLTNGTGTCCSPLLDTAIPQRWDAASRGLSGSARLIHGCLFAHCTWIH